MANWKAELDTLVDETMAFVNRMAKTRRHEPLLSMHTIPPLDVQREEISRRVELFKAHQQRLIRDRQDYAASALKRMCASS